MSATGGGDGGPPAAGPAAEGDSGDGPERHIAVCLRTGLNVVLYGPTPKAIADAAGLLEAVRTAVEELDRANRIYLVHAGDCMPAVRDGLLHDVFTAAWDLRKILEIEHASPGLASYPLAIQGLIKARKLAVEVSDRIREQDPRAIATRVERILGLLHQVDEGRMDGPIGRVKRQEDRIQEEEVASIIERGCTTDGVLVPPALRTWVRVHGRLPDGSDSYPSDSNPVDFRNNVLTQGYRQDYECRLAAGQPRVSTPAGSDDINRLLIGKLGLSWNEVEPLTNEQRLDLLQKDGRPDDKPAEVLAVSPNDPRDQFCYEQRKAGKITDDSIMMAVNKTPGWEHLETSQGVRDAADRYAVRHHQPLIRKRNRKRKPD